MWLRNRLDNYLRIKTYRLWLGLLLTCMVASVIPDIDHPIAFYLGIPNGRFLMPHFNLAGYILAGCGSIILIACLGRYAWVRFLSNG